jgi:hypothetical protein
MLDDEKDCLTCSSGRWSLFFFSVFVSVSIFFKNTPHDAVIRVTFNVYNFFGRNSKEEAKTERKPRL